MQRLTSCTQLRPQAIHVCVSNFHGQAATFADALRESLVQMLALLSSSSAPVPARL
jgi:hypothetical protein